MIETLFFRFDTAIDAIREKLIEKGQVIRTEKWQGIPLEHDMFEVLNTSFKVDMPNDLGELRVQLKPNLPWADEHFEERVGGIPMNPDPSHVNWPFRVKDNEKFKEDDKFTHTYSERFWPKYAAGGFPNIKNSGPLSNPGIRYDFGDLQDVINLLYKEPLTRQAYIPIFFPEDTGAVHGGRIPCTLGYHLIMRDNKLHIVYYIRSCDYLRHFRDDIYMAVKLVYWVIQKLQEKANYNHLMENQWKDVIPGTFTMHITSLHIFQNEVEMVKKFKR